MDYPQINKEVILKLESYLSILKLKWDALYPKRDSFYFGSSRIVDCTAFLISVLDNLVLFVQDNIPKGTDRKIAVMAVASKIFEYIISKSSPIWLQPFIPAIKLVVGIVTSQLVEFIVKKYKEGAWNQASPVADNPPDAVQKSLIYTSKKEHDG